MSLWVATELNVTDTKSAVYLVSSAFHHFPSFYYLNQKFHEHCHSSPCELCLYNGSWLHMKTKLWPVFILLKEQTACWRKAQSAQLSNSVASCWEVTSESAFFFFLRKSAHNFYWQKKKMSDMIIWFCPILSNSFYFVICKEKMACLH